jgi:hypothetical protein
MGMGLYLGLWVRGRGREERKWEDYTQTPVIKKF